MSDTTPKGKTKTSEKDNQKLLRQKQREEEMKAAQAALNKQAEDIESDTFGYLPIIASACRTDRVWTSVDMLDSTIADSNIWLRARVQDTRGKGSLGFLILRQQMFTVQAVLDAGKSVPKEMIKWAAAMPLESVVDVYGIVRVPDVDITATTQNVELHVLKLFGVGKTERELPFQLKDANRSDADTSEDVIHVLQDTRLDNRVLDLRTLANQAIFRIESMICQLFREFLYSHNFIEIHSPKLIGGASEGGANCFKLKYFDSDACLAQSPQLYKQMAISADFDRVFEIGPVFRAENSNTHRHLCEFTGLDFEMTFKEHYFEVLDLVDDLFCFIFRGLNQRCPTEIETVFKQHAATPLLWPEKTVRLEFVQGVQMLREANYEGIPDDLNEFDLSTEQEKALGNLVREKYNTDFYSLVRFPTKVRAFYSMECPDDRNFCNSYDYYIRGEEILSGAQRVHDPAMLTRRCKEFGIDPKTLEPYIDSFRLGVYPHAGIGVGLERVAMLFLGLTNVRKVSLFPRDPKRLNP